MAVTAFNELIVLNDISDIVQNGYIIILLNSYIYSKRFKDAQIVYCYQVSVMITKDCFEVLVIFKS
ncbi:hypothetical protein SDC9_129517 [bioreactor metagenome]|uniref:Uncharacterized protein n=1 Tax=bioreactor metagenome TaxID=1076179 RepID=A0A645CZ77_9ZZZZ